MGRLREGSMGRSGRSGEFTWPASRKLQGSNAKTDVAAAAWATPRVGTRLLLATAKPNFNFFFFNLPNSKNNSCRDGRVKDQAELPRGLRGIDQQADQHGILCLVRLSFHEFLLQPG